ncbi:MAG: PHP domain-containing protein [Clostridia bacterium]|nr:PHP domain-containing protein [Clostridia bacterium]
MIDLHTHTIFSDGEFSPAKNIEIAKDMGITVLSLTDHDSLGIAEEAIGIGNMLGVTVIPGIEVTAFDETELHILGYKLDSTKSVIEDYKKYVRKVGLEEDNAVFEFFQKKGMNVTREDTERLFPGEKFVIYHILHWLVVNGYETQESEAYRRYFINGELKDRKRGRISVKDAIKFIIDAGGIPVWAHPYRSGLTDYKDILGRTKFYKSYGLRGLEVYYSLHTPKDVELLLDIAKKEDLGITLGSDYHGPKIKDYIEMGKGSEESLVPYQTPEIIDEICNFIL